MEREPNEDWQRCQILFTIVPLSKRLCVGKDRSLRCLSDTGRYKLAYGDFHLRPNNIYSFTFLIINAFNVKLGVVEKTVVERLAAEKNFRKTVFSEKDKFLVLSSTGKIERIKSSFIDEHLCRNFAALDKVTTFVDTYNGRVQFLLNGKDQYKSFVLPRLKTNVHCPIIFVLGQNVKIKLIPFYAP